MIEAEFSQSSIKRGLLHARSLYEHAKRTEIERGAETRLYIPTFMTPELDIFRIDYHKYESYSNEIRLKTYLANAALALVGQPPTVQHSALVMHSSFTENKEQSLQIFHELRSPMQHRPYLLHAEAGERADALSSHPSSILSTSLKNPIPLDRERTAELYDSFMSLTTDNLYAEDGLRISTEHRVQLYQESSENIRRIFAAQETPAKRSSRVKGLRYLVGDEGTELSLHYDPKKPYYDGPKQIGSGPGAVLSALVHTDTGIRARVSYHIKMNNSVYPAGVNANMVLWREGSIDGKNKPLPATHIDLVSPDVLEYFNTLLTRIALHAEYGLPIEVETMSASSLLTREIEEQLQPRVPLPPEQSLKAFVESQL